MDAGPGVMEASMTGYPARTAVPLTPFDKLAQEFAKHGFRLAPLVGDRLLVSRWGLSGSLSGMDEARAFLKKIVGGQHE
jgi:hypothetical protein